MICHKIEILSSQKIYPVELQEILNVGYQAVPTNIKIVQDGKIYSKCYLHNDKQKSHYGFVWIEQVEFQAPASSNVIPLFREQPQFQPLSINI